MGSVYVLLHFTTTVKVNFVSLVSQVVLSVALLNVLFVTVIKFQVLFLSTSVSAVTVSTLWTNSFVIIVTLNV